MSIRVPQIIAVGFTILIISDIIPMAKKSMTNFEIHFPRNGLIEFLFAKGFVSPF